MCSRHRSILTGHVSLGYFDLHYHASWLKCKTASMAEQRKEVHQDSRTVSLGAPCTCGIVNDSVVDTVMTCMVASRP